MPAGRDRTSSCFSKSYWSRSFGVISTALFPLPQVPAGEILTNVRQADAVRRAAENMEAACEALEAGMTPDIILTETENAMQALGELTGASIREDVTNQIFARFCVGK